MATGAGGPAGQRSGFVGRRRELAELVAILEQAAGGRGQLVLIGGEPGIGKTRLAEETVAEARRRGFAVSWGQCGEGAEAHPYWPWIQVLRDLGPEAAGPLGAMEGTPDGAAGLAHDGDQLGRLRLFDATVQVLRMAAGQPRIIVIDDLQWADAASRLLLGFLAPMLPAAALVLVATQRSGEPGGDIRPAHAIELRGLPEEELGDLVAAVSPKAAEPGATRRIHRRTGGNPLFARELARLLDLPGDPADLPVTVRAVLGRQLDGLSPGCRSVLEAASVMGETVDPAVVAGIAARPLSEVLDLLDEARHARLIVTADVAQASFVHDLVREAVIGRIPAAKRAELHQRAGEALEALLPNRPDLAGDAARHFTAAAGPEAPAKAVRYAAAAADRCMARFAYEEAARLYAQAHAAAHRSPGAGDEVWLLRCLASTLLAAGDTTASRAAYAELAARARDRGDTQVLAEAALGMGSGPAGFDVTMLDDIQIAAVEEALRALGPDPSALRSQLLARLSLALTYVESEARRVELAEQAVAVARSVGDPRAVAGALAAHCDAVAGPDHVATRLEETAEMLVLATGLGDEQLELMARRLRVAALLEVGDLAAAGEQIDAFARSTAARHQALYGWYVPMWRAMAALLDGSMDGARRHLSELVALSQRTGSFNATIHGYTLRWCLDLVTGDGEDVARVLEESDLGAIPGVWPVVALARSQIALGQPAAARASLDRAAPLLKHAPRDSELLAMLGQLAEVVWELGGHPVASVAYDMLHPYRGLMLVEGGGAAVRGSVERPLGQLATALGHLDAAVQHFEAAAARARSLDAPLLEAEARTALDRIRGGPAANPLGSAGAKSSGTLRLDGRVWTLGFAGREIRLPDSKGLRDLARLVANPGKAMAALDLATGARSTPGGAPAPERGDLPGTPGDLGEVLDATGRETFKRRLRDLDGEIDDADSASDLERASRARAERDALLDALRAAYGLGGRPRHPGHPAERARSTVTARIRHAIGLIEGSHPELGRHLRHSVKTGAWCRYDPEEPVAWTVTAVKAATR
ncbi:MAG TPA: AAA family ATPase [Actinomycetota bacterium]|nr:AAA family ATPase [Actinomycetota bacterium]